MIDSKKACEVRAGALTIVLLMVGTVDGPMCPLAQAAAVPCLPRAADTLTDSPAACYHDAAQQALPVYSVLFARDEYLRSEMCIWSQVVAEDMPVFVLDHRFARDSGRSTEMLLDVIAIDLSLIHI